MFTTNDTVECRDNVRASNSTSLEENCKKDEEDKNLNNKSSQTVLRRSQRNINAIKLTGGNNQSFFRNLHTLFFEAKILPRNYQAILSNTASSSLRVAKVTNRRQAPIYVLDQFLTERELDYFDKKIQTVTFERSFVDNMNYGKHHRGDEALADSGKKGGIIRPLYDKNHVSPPRTIVDDTHRTSTFYSFEKLHDARIRALEQRIANMLGCWVHQIEPLQLVRYFPGQFFGLHHDMGDLLENDTVKLPPKDICIKRRLVTLFCYLNTLETDQGGATYFPQCGNLRIHPHRGRAVLWSNVTADGQPDARTVHAGEPVKVVLGGTKRRKTNAPSTAKPEPGVVKYGLNIWICED